MPLDRVSFSPFLLPSRVSFSAKMLPKGYTLFKFLLPDRTTAYFLDPLLPHRVWFLPFCSQTGVFKLRKMLPDRVKITAPQRHTPVHIRTKCPPPRGETPSKFDQKMENFFSSIFNSSLTCEYVYLVHSCPQALNIHKICVLSRVV